MTLTFNQWLKAVDSILEDAVGFGHDHLRDCNWRDLFDDGITPKEATEEIISDPWSAI